MKDANKKPEWYRCLSPLATLVNEETAYRKLPPEEDEDNWRFSLIDSPFEVDFLKILESKCYRRLSGKAQVITRTLTPDISFDRTPHIRTRLAHTSDVVGFACSLAHALGLNEPLVRAGALGHDLGHLPLGHDSEYFFAEIGRPIRHEVFALYLVQFIERRTPGGLNLTRATLRIIRRHSRGRQELTLESEMSQEERLVLYADKLAYLSADPSDIFIKFRRTLSNNHVLARQLDELWEPVKKALSVFSPDGSLPNQRFLQRCWGSALCLESVNQGKISFEKSDIAHQVNTLRELMIKTYPLLNYGAIAGYGPLHWSYKLLCNLGKTLDVDPLLLYALLCDRELLEISQLPAWRETVPNEVLKHLSLIDILPFLTNRQLPSFDEKSFDW